MVSNDKSICQNCGSKLKRYDKVSRIVRTKGGKTSWIEIERFRCPVCGQIHRELPDYIFPYKQYEAEVIRGVLEGFITCETYGYEDYPCPISIGVGLRRMNMKICMIISISLMKKWEEMVRRRKLCRKSTNYPFINQHILKKISRRNQSWNRL